MIGRPNRTGSGWQGALSVIARMLSPPGRRPRPLVAGLLLLWITGCHTIGKRHEEKRIAQYGIVDPDQARELQKISFPTYVIEPPDELDIAVRPALADWSPGT